MSLVGKGYHLEHMYHDLMTENCFALSTNASNSARLKFFVRDAVQTTMLSNQLTILYKETAQSTE
jgi:hypothetical protein